MAVTLVTCIRVPRSERISYTSVGYCLFVLGFCQNLLSDKLTTPHFLFSTHPVFHGVGGAKKSVQLMCYTQDEFVIQDINPMTTEGRKALLVKRTDNSVKMVVELQLSGTTVSAVDPITGKIWDCMRLKEGKKDVDLSNWKPDDVLISYLYC